jgi:hypothetical protein
VADLDPARRRLIVRERRRTDELWEETRPRGNVARYPLIDITNAVISRMLLGGPGPDGSDPGFATQGAIFYEVRSVGQKSNGMLEQLFVRPTMAVLNAAADGSLYGHPGTGWGQIPFGDGGALRRRPELGIDARGLPSQFGSPPAARSRRARIRRTGPAHPQDVSRPRSRPSIAAPTPSRSGRCRREPSRSSPRPRAGRPVQPGPRCWYRVKL